MFEHINKLDEARLKCDAEYEKTVNGVQLWKGPNGYRLFKRDGKQMLFAGAFSPLRHAEDIARRQ